MELIQCIYLVSLVFAICSGVYRYRVLDMAAKIFCIYLSYTFVAECLATYAAERFHNNMSVYAIYNLGEVVFMAMYFNYSIDLFKKLHIGVYIAGAGIIVGACDIIFVEGPYSMDAYFMFFEGFCIIGMCLFSFFRLLIKQEPIKLTRYPHFWITAVVLLYRTITYIYWGLYNVFSVKLSKDIMILNRSIVVLNIMCYCVIGLVYLLYSRMQEEHE